MAIDTALKRLSLLGLGVPGIDLPFPDGSIANGADRGTLLGVYAGAIGVAVAVVTPAHRTATSAPAENRSVSSTPDL